MIHVFNLLEGKYQTIHLHHKQIYICKNLVNRKYVQFLYSTCVSNMRVRALCVQTTLFTWVDKTGHFLQPVVEKDCDRLYRPPQWAADNRREDQGKGTGSEWPCGAAAAPSLAAAPLWGSAADRVRDNKLFGFTDQLESRGNSNSAILLRKLLGHGKEKRREAANTWEERTGGLLLEVEVERQGKRGMGPLPDTTSANELIKTLRYLIHWTILCLGVFRSSILTRWQTLISRWLASLI